MTEGPLIEVAVTLPVAGTFTYRDPRGGPPPPIGVQVVVPFGRRTVTGFVVGHPDVAPAPPRDIEEVVGDEPAFDAEMLELCRWAAEYYMTPLGEVLRAALPQGERARATRVLRLTEEGRKLAATGTTGDRDHREAVVLAALVRAGGVMKRRALEREVPDLRRLLPRLATRGLVVPGDDVTDPRALPTVSFAVASVSASAALPARARESRLLLDRVGSRPEGFPLLELGTRERAQVRRLAKRGLIRIERRPAPRGPSAAAAEASSGPARLTAAQDSALSTLQAALGGGYAPFVLQGVTGSGKTEVYLRLIAVARSRNLGALVLVPEIALTPQLAARFRARFGDDVAVLHSGLPLGERLTAWRRLRSGEVAIALGARSAIFAPVRRLGVVVVDEEHDSSFKQEEGFRYNARDLAMVRARSVGAVALLGSATPSLETFENARRGRYKRLLLPERATPRPLPAVEVVDLRRQPTGPDGLVSFNLAEAIAGTLAGGEQAILFLNRRGFATVMLCAACGHVVRCSQCAISLTYHRGRDRLVCHYCGNAREPPALCPSCRAPRLERLGAGTERLEAIVKERFPGARVARLDRDTVGRGPADATSPRALDVVLGEVAEGRVDILVGTQMVTKGHDFAGVTLVGVLRPDQGMHLPDFRAAERTYQLLEQVAGRAGRGARPGRVIIQTYSPEHPAVEHVLTHDYDGFARGELERRKEAGYPPFARMVALRFDGPDPHRVRSVAAEATRRARAGGGTALRVLGPAEAPIPRLRGRSRFQVWLTSPDRGSLSRAARAAADAPLPPDVRLAIDVDPQSVL